METCAAVETAANRADKARWKAAMYRLASHAFLKEPTDEELAGLVETARAALAAGEGWNLPCEKELLDSLAALDAADDSLGTQVRSEYAELFVGPRPPLAPLYESLYVGFPRRLLTETTRKVRDTYERCGLTVEQRNRIPDDHLGFELEFMARLAEREADALEASDAQAADEAAAEQERFIREHLGQWTHPFCEKVQAAPGMYYRAWAAFVRDFVDSMVAADVAEAGER